MPKPALDPLDQLRAMLDGDHRPILWLGAGVSCQAEPPLPTLWSLIDTLARDFAAHWVSPQTDDAYAIIDDFVREVSEGELHRVLERELRPGGRLPSPGALHHYLAKLIAAGRFSLVIDTNYDLLLRRACEEIGAPLRFSQLDRNLHLPDEGMTLYLALHGTMDDWRSVVLTGRSHAEFDQRHPLAVHQLALKLRQHRVLFVGCSLQDPRLVGWMVGLSTDERRLLHLWQAVMGPGEVAKLEQVRWTDGRSYAEVLEHVRCLELPDFETLPRWFGEIAVTVVESRMPPKYAFVSHAPVDTLLAMKLGRALLEHGVRPWLEIWDGRAGDAEQRMREAKVVLVCEAMGVGVEPTDHAGRVIRVRLSRSADGQLEVVLRGGSKGVETLAQQIGVDRERKRWRALEAEAMGEPEDELRPYRGLKAFEEKHARWMFGRDEELEKLVELARSQSLLTVIGASGSGKSSLVMAGLCPALRCGMLGERVTKIAVLRPSQTPCASLASAMVGLDPSDALDQSVRVVGLRDRMLAANDMLRVFVEQLGGKGKVLLVIDQLEELFTEAGLGGKGDVADAMAFVRNVVAATRGRDAPLRVVSTLRADFLSECLGVVEMAPMLDSNIIHMAQTPLRKEQVREAVELPARRVGFEVDHGLSVKLVDGVAEQTERLPLLQYVLDELWKQRDEPGRRVPLAAYEETGGLEEAIATAADRALKMLRGELGSKAEVVTRSVMYRLVNVGVTSQADTRKRAGIEELGTDEVTARVLDVFVREARVLVSDRVGQVQTIEIAHEALLRKWGKLEKWLNADREALRVREDLARDAKMYEMKRGYLWPKGRVDEAKRVLGRSAVELSDGEHGFLDASRGRAFRISVVAGLAVAMLVLAVVGLWFLNAENEHRAEESRRLADSERLAREESERRARENAALVEATQSAIAVQKALQASLIIEHGGSYVDAAILMIEAAATSPNVPDLPNAETEHALEQIMRTPGIIDVAYLRDSVTAFAFSPDGTRIATVGWDSTAEVWDSNSGQLLLSLEGHSEAVAVAFFPDGTRIATADSNSTARVWDSNSGQLLTLLPSLEGHDEAVGPLAFSPDGSRIATVNGKTARVWDSNSGQLLIPFKGHSEIVEVAFSPDGTRIATASDTVRVWDSNSGQLFTSLEDSSSGVNAVAFSPDGTRIAIAGWEAVRVWDSNSGQLITSLKSHSNFDADAVAFSPDGSRIATARLDTASVWDSNSGQLLTSLECSSDEDADGGEAVAFSPDGSRIVTGGRTARVWDKSDQLLSRLSHSSDVTGLTFSPDGTRIATVSDNTAHVWDPKSGQHIISLNSEHVNTVAFSPDGTRIATAGWDSTARVWDSESGQHIISLNGHSENINAVAFSPDGSRIVTASDDKTTRVWDSNSGQQLTSLNGHSEEVNAVAFSPDGTRIVTASDDKTARVWDSNSGQQLTSFNGHSDKITSVVFLSDASRIATASYDKTARVWDPNSGKILTTLHTQVGRSNCSLLPEPFIRSSSCATAFSLDGSRIAAAVGTSVSIWDSNSGHLLTSLESHSDYVSAVAFSPDGSRLATASFDNTVLIWPVDRFPLILHLCTQLERSLRYPEVKDICESIPQTYP